MSLDMGGIISQMGVVSLPILLGYVLHRLGIPGGEFDRRLTTLVLDIALLYAVIASVLGNVFMFTVGAGMFRTRGLARAADAGTRPRAGRARRLASVLASLKTPTIVAGVATLVLALVGVSDLGIVGSAMSVVGQMSTPAALLIVGSSLAQYDPLEMVSNPHSYVATAAAVASAQSDVELLDAEAKHMHRIEPLARLRQQQGE